MKKIFFYLKQDVKLLPIEVMIFLLPFFTRGVTITENYEGAIDITDDNMYIDYYLSCKAYMLGIIACIMLGVIIFEIRKKDKSEKKNYLREFCLLFVVGILAVASTIFAIHPKHALLGTFGVTEPLYVILSYIIVFLYAVCFIENKADIDKILWAAALGCILVSSVGIIQMLGYNVYEKNWFIDLTSTKKQVEDFGYERKIYMNGRVSSTLFNSNYVGSYVSLYFPVILYALFTNKKLYKKIVYVFSLAGLGVFLYGSRSLTGIMALIITICFICAFCVGRIIKRKWILYLGIVLVLFAGTGFIAVSDGSLARKIKNVKTDTEQFPLVGIETGENGVLFKFIDTECIVDIKTAASMVDIRVYENDEKREVVCNNNNYYCTLGTGRVIRLRPSEYEGKLGFGIIGNQQWLYFIREGETYKYITDNFFIDDCIISERVFKGKERMASWRGIVWGASVPLLKKYIFVGAGPDNFVFAYPQKDYVIRKLDGNNDFFTRPHNMFLQIGIQEGVVALLCFLAFVILYYVDCFRLYYYRKQERDTLRMGIAFMASVTAFLICGMANDSMVVTTPIFWILFGMGYVVNKKIADRFDIDEKRKI